MASARAHRRPCPERLRLYEGKYTMVTTRSTPCVGPWPAAPRADAERACARGPSKDQGAFISIGEGCVGTSIVAKAQDTNTKNVLFYASSARRKLRGRRRVG